MQRTVALKSSFRPSPISFQATRSRKRPAPPVKHLTEDPVETPSPFSVLRRPRYRSLVSGYCADKITCGLITRPYTGDLGDRSLCHDPVTFLSVTKTPLERC